MTGRVSTEIGRCNGILLEDEEKMEMEDEERDAVMAEINALEQEFGYWCKVFSGRMQEKKVRMMMMMKVMMVVMVQTKAR
jgi:hypothetical protein